MIEGMEGLMQRTAEEAGTARIRGIPLSGRAEKMMQDRNLDIEAIIANRTIKVKDVVIVMNVEAAAVGISDH